MERKALALLLPLVCAFSAFACGEDGSLDDVGQGDASANDANGDLDARPSGDGASENDGSSSDSGTLDSGIDSGIGDDDDDDDDAGPDGGPKAYRLTSSVGPRGVGACNPATGAVIIPAPADPDDTSLDDVINAVGPNKAICLKSGIHRADNAIVLKRGQQLVGETTAIVDGSQRLQTWTVSGSTWWAPMVLPTTPFPTDHCSAGSPKCNEVNDAWFNGKLLKKATAAANVQANEVFFDYANQRVYVGKDPTGNQVVASRAFSRGLITAANDADGVFVSNLIVQYAGTPRQIGALHTNKTWTVEHNEFQWIHGTCLRMPPGNGSITRWNSIHDCGQNGVRGNNGDDPQSPDHVGGHLYTFSENEITRTNYAGYDVIWEAGASKFSSSDGILIQKNWFHEHPQAGIWVDVNGTNVTIDGNWITDNGLSDFDGTPFTANQNLGRGIFYEVSCNGIIKNNVLINNGRNGARGGERNAGIYISESHTVDVFNNIVRGNGDGIIANENQRPSTDGLNQPGIKGYCATWDAAGNPVADISTKTPEQLFYQVHRAHIHDNTIEMWNPDESATGAVQGYASTLYNPQRDITFERNTYTVPTGNLGKNWFRWGAGATATTTAEISWTAWKALGHDDTAGASLSASAPSSSCRTPTPDILSPTKLGFNLVNSSAPVTLWARAKAPHTRGKRFWYVDSNGCADIRVAETIGAYAWVKLDELPSTAAAQQVRLVRAENGTSVDLVFAVPKADTCGGSNAPTGDGSNCTTAQALSATVVP